MDESALSSASRSSLGDTRSIVLALQALQEKIRKLEIDRNYHQEQCERARAHHEEYKRDVEAQLERERAEHRRREAEHQDLISRATAERTTLQSTLEESRRDIGQFRSELENLLERERRDAAKRDEKLQVELNQLHADLAKERRNAEYAQKQADQLRAEKETIESTNRRLEETLAELIAMNNQLLSKQPQTARKAVPAHAIPSLAVNPPQAGGAYGNRSGSTGQRGVMSGRNGHTHGHNASAASVPSRAARPSSAQRRGPTGSKHYEVDTFNSTQRCERFATHEQSFQERRSTSNQRSSMRHPTPPRQHFDDGVKTTSPREKKFDERLEALDELYEELRVEHEALNQRYATVVRRAGDPDGKGVAPGQLTAELNAIMGQIDRKNEQMQMVRQSRERLEREGADRPVKGPRNPVKGFDKATRKTALVNELRSLLQRSVQ